MCLEQESDPYQEFSKAQVEYLKRREQALAENLLKIDPTYSLDERALSKRLLICPAIMCAT